MKFARLLQVMHRHCCGGTCHLAGLLSVKYRRGPDFAFTISSISASIFIWWLVRLNIVFHFLAQRRVAAEFHRDRWIYIAACPSSI